MTEAAEVVGTPADDRCQWKDRSVLAAGVVALAIGYAQFAPITVLGDVAELFGRNAAAAGVTAAGLGAGLGVIRLAGLASPVIAAQADRVGRRTVLVAATAIGVAATAIGGLALSFPIFVAVVALGRPFLSAANATVGVIVGERSTSADRASAVTVVTAAYGIGAGLPAALRAATDGALGFRWSMAAVGAVALIAVVAARWVSEPAEFRRATVGPRVRLRELPLGQVLPLAAVTAAGGLVTGPLNGFLFVVGKQDLGLRPAAVSLLFVLGGPMGMVGLLAGRWGADHRGRVRTAQVGVVAVAVAGAIAYSGSFAALAAGYPLGVFGVSLLAPSIGALAIEVIPTTVRGAVSGILAAAATAAGVVGLVTAGVIATATGSYGVPMTIIAVAALPAIWAVGHIQEPQRSGAMEATAPVADARSI